MRSSSYRKIWTLHNGPIPKDSTGRSYEIHHIDGDHTNNNIKNLKLVTLQEHYNIHHSQGDFGACLLMASRLKLTPAEISILASKRAKKSVANGTHNWLGGEIQRRNNINRVAAGKHPWAGEKAISKSAEFKLARSTEMAGANNPKYDHTIYSWAHKSGISVNLTRNELMKTYGLLSSSISGLFSGKLKSTSGWKLR